MKSIQVIISVLVTTLFLGMHDKINSVVCINIICTKIILDEILQTFSGSKRKLKLAVLNVGTLHHFFSLPKIN